MAKSKDFSDDQVFEGWRDSASQAIDKKFYNQGLSIYIRRKRTSNTAFSVVDKLRKVPVDSVRLLLTVYHDQDEVRPELIQKYENELLEARTNPTSYQV